MWQDLIKNNQTLEDTQKALADEERGKYYSAFRDYIRVSILPIKAAEDQLAKQAAYGGVPQGVQQLPAAGAETGGLGGMY